jgi:2-oxoglutarate ferredoxin oxidoreductase subunit beta
MEALEAAERGGEILTGVLYVNTHKPDFLELLGLSEHPLATLPESQVRPSKAVLEAVMDELR